MLRFRQTQIVLGSIAIAALAASAFAQPQADMNISAPKVEVPPAELLTLPDPNSPEMVEYRAFQKRRVGLDRQLKKIRATYFKNIRNVEIRQAGIERLRDFTDPASFPSMLEIFRREGDDVREAILDHLAGLNTDEADGTLAWTAVFDPEKKIRESATQRLAQRFEDTDKVPESVRSVVAMGLRKDRSDDEIGSAAHVANMLRIYDAIPMMINAQVRGGGNASDGTGALAYILVGSQQAYVSDLQPIVANSAVAFDPTISVVTDGVIMAVYDAVVVTYHMEVYYSLNDLTRKGYGDTPPKRLGFDQRKWNDWYADEFLPHRKEIESAQAQAAEASDGLPKPPGGG
jgi:hypothetical protein